MILAFMINNFPLSDEQYFKMDPKNFDDYGGVEHLNYCFEVPNVNFAS